jgi:adenylate kinase
MKLMIIGPQGSGKGTYASRISAALGIPHISTGQIFRDNIAAKTDLGKQVEGFINKGVLVPDETTMKVVKDRLAKPDAKKGFIFDGFPRNLKQAEELDKFLKLDHVIYLNVPEWLLLERISSRVTCRKCGKIYNLMSIKPKKSGVCDDCLGELYVRDDEKPEAIKTRLREYEKNTKPLVDYYKNKGLLRTAVCDNRDMMPEEAVKNIMKMIGAGDAKK